MTTRAHRILNAEFPLDPADGVCRYPACPERGVARRRPVALLFRGWGYTVSYYCDACGTFIFPGMLEMAARYPECKPGSVCPKCGDPHIGWERHCASLDTELRRTH